MGAREKNKTKQNNNAREGTEKKKPCAEEAKKKNGPVEWIVTLYRSFNFVVVAESPFTCFSLQLGKWAFFPFKAETFMRSNIIMATDCHTWSLQKTLADNHGLKVF